jgi:spore germination cell wall hydrolase CwlJ-like protein
VIVNRRNKGGWFGKDLRSVILKPKQFSCFNLSDPNRIKLMGIAGDWEGKFDYDKALRDCFYVAEGVLNGQFVDPTGGATHYEVKGTGAAWAKSMVVTDEIGHHVFYKEKA